MHAFAPLQKTRFPEANFGACVGSTHGLCSFCVLAYFALIHILSFHSSNTSPLLIDFKIL